MAPDDPPGGSASAGAAGDDAADWTSTETDERADEAADEAVGEVGGGGDATDATVTGDGADDGRRTFAVDLHAHTRFFHGLEGRATPYDPLGVRLLGLFARRRGLDAVGLTNHDYYRPFDAGPTPPSLLPGIEISTTRGHVVVVGPDPPERTRKGVLTPEEAVELAHDRGCAAVIPHPYRSSTVRESDAPFDAVEVNGKHPGEIEAVRSLAADRGLPVVGGSDAHYPFEVGRAYTRVEAADLAPASVAEAIREGRVEPAVVDTPVDRLLQRGYRYVHRLKALRAASPGATDAGSDRRRE